MKRLQAICLLLSLLLGCVFFPACDSTPSDVVISGDELFPNEDENNTPTTPPDGSGEGEGNPSGGENEGGEEEPPEEDTSGGIGKNEAVDLPFVPV
ncbi:MAG: hypothetical protein IJY20_07370 [Clostridia bacterium]|nr:hypothetical protein [Clostridia bacterium]